MQKLLIYILVGLASRDPANTGLSVPAEALECGVILGDANKEVNQAVTTCLLPTIPVVESKIDNATKANNFTDEDDLEETPVYGPRRGMKNRIKRQEPTTITPTTMATNSTPVPGDIRDKNKEAKDAKKCVVQCIFKEFNMLDGRMLPDHALVSQGLLRFVESREMQDFIQDSIDDCFGKMLERVENDSCGYSAKLITCLAEKGRYNCADWPVGELPFPHKF